MNVLKKLAGQTAIYGLSSILGRFLNYLLVPLYTYQFPNPGDYGVVAEFYAYLSFLGVILGYGMETAYFNYSSRREDKLTVLGTAQASLLLSTVGFVWLGLQFADEIAESLRHPQQVDFVRWCIWILACDALSAIPFARLRQQQRAGRFALLKSANILVNVLANVFWIGLCKWSSEHGGSAWLDWAGEFWDERIGIGYVFIANLLASALTLLLLLPELLRHACPVDLRLWFRMLGYGLPLLIAGMAGMVNETLDRILLKYLLPEPGAMEQLGVYGACYKISILMTLFIQAYRYAAEPFFFAQHRDEPGRTVYAITMHGFIITASGIFLAVMMNLSWIQYFVGERYRSGLAVAPILLMANLCLGVFYNFSVWYKLTEQTRFGTYLSLWGATVTLALNYYGIPLMGYLASAWATLICYASMAGWAYVLGRKFFPVPYDLRRIVGYPLLAGLLAMAADILVEQVDFYPLALRNAMLPVFGVLVWALEKSMLQRK